MKRILIILLLAVVAFPAFAQMGSPIIIPIWPDGAPNDNGIVTEEGHPSPRSVDNVSKPELWVFPAFRPNGTVIIACPGGGYYYLEIEKEGTGLAPWFNYIGVTLAVLKYRMPNGHFETTLSDVQEAVKIMRKHTEDWGGNPERVGVMGCSAGGNLAIQAAVQFTSRENRPDFQILLYPFTTMNDFENNIMFGPDASEELIRKYSVLEQIKPDTPGHSSHAVPTIRLFLSTTASSTSRNCRPERSHLCYTSILPEVMAGAKDPGSITAESGRRNWNAGLSSGSSRVTVLEKSSCHIHSLRPGSNSHALAEQFAEGAKSAGNEVELISLKWKEIKFCIGCLSCQKTGACVFKDDVPAIMDSVLNADVVCWATPVYYYEMSGQMKTLIDRMNAMYPKDYRFRDIYLLTTAAESEENTPKRAESGLQGWIDCYEKSALKAHLFCGGVNNPREINGNPKLQEAFELGKNV